MAMLAWPVAACSSNVEATSETAASSSTGTAASSGSTSDPAESSGSTVAIPGSSSGGVGSSSSDSSAGSSSTGVVLPDPCDTFTQDCPPGFKCNPFANDGGSSWNDRMCVPVDDEPDGYGEPCTVVDSGVSGFDSCDVGSMCLVLGADTLEGECVELCGGSESEPTCVQEEAFCQLTAEGAFNPCFISCDPLGDDCDVDQTCVSSLGDEFLCAAEGQGQYTDPCRFINDCEEGLGCFDAVESVCDVREASCCLPYCDLQTPDCPDGLGCVPFFNEAAPRGYENLGVCFEPA